MTQSNSQNALKEICPHEAMEYQREHYRGNRELNHFYDGPISKYRENSYGCFRHYPVWTGFRSWDPQYRSLHTSITGDGVRARVVAYHILMIFFKINATWKISYLYIEAEYHLLALHPITVKQVCTRKPCAHFIWPMVFIIQDSAYDYAYDALVSES